MVHQQDRDRDSDDALGWLSAVLWPDGRAEIRAGHAGPRTWWASPSASDPQILIPADAPAAARRAVRRYHDGFDLGRRAKSLLAEATMSVPGLPGVLLRGARVGERAASSPSPSPSPSASASSPSPSSTPVAEAVGVLDGLADLLDQSDLVVAVSLSVPKSNRKPVLQLLTPSGRCLGWAKVGWSPISERLVANEAAWLDRRASSPIPLGRSGLELVVPRLLHDEVVAGRRVVITSPVDVARRPADRPDALPPVELFGAVAARGTVDTVPLVESSWWRSVQDALVAADADVGERAAVEATADAADGHRFDVGGWHGDLTPWNLMRSGRKVQLIDWELAADGVPVGFDLCHFHTQVGAEMKGLSGAAALDRSARLSPQGLAALGVDARNHTVLWRLYLVELVRRMLVLRADGFPVERLDHGPAALARLSAMAARRGATSGSSGGAAEAGAQPVAPGVGR